MSAALWRVWPATRVFCRPPSRTRPAWNEAFAPSAKAVDDARGILAAWDAGAGGVVTYNGRMIENLHVESAKRVLAIHDAIVELGA